MNCSIITVVFEYTDAHMSVVDDLSMIEDFESRCVKLCEVFDFEYELIFKRMDCTPHWSFKVLFTKDILKYPHYMNVLAAFAQEFQINIACAYERQA